MKKTILLLAVILVIASCRNSEKHENPEETHVETTQDATETEPEEPILIGIHKRPVMEVEPYSEWYTENYEYEPDEETLTELKKNLNKISFTIFMGTWCSDSQMHVPAFYRILDEMDYDSERTNLIMVSRDKDTPEGFEKGKDIQFVPTFIVYKDGKELGRIVEFPVETLEKDLLRIVKGEDYKHSYAD